MAKKTKQQQQDRDAKGRFVEGCPGGPGRPPRELERGYLRAFSQGLPEETLVAIVQKLAKQALRGDTAAARLLLTTALPPGSRTHLHQSTDQAFRVAGRTASEVDTAMVDRLMRKVLERRAYEASLAKQESDR